jgi:hypothetical protein
MTDKGKGISDALHQAYAEMGFDRGFLISSSAEGDLNVKLLR